MKTLLFVCTGNTCRSPMAACLMNDLALRLGKSVHAVSAGVGAWPGMEATEGAKRAMERRGLSLENHLSQPVTRRLLERADWAVGMNEGHARRLKAMGVLTPIRAFDDPPITDPYGGGDDVYEQAARDIERQLPALLAALEAEGGKR